MHRAPTSGENRLFDELRGGGAPRDDVWFTGAIPESPLAVAAHLVKADGRRVLLIALDTELQNDREIRLLHRVPLRRLSGDEKTKSRLPRGPLLVLADARSLDSWARCFGGEEFDFVFVEGVEAAAPRAPEFRPAFARFPSLLDRLRTARFVFFAARVLSDAREESRTLLGGARPFVELDEPLESFDLRLALEAGSEALVRVIEELPRPAWIVCASPQVADRAYAILAARQVPCHRYHSAMAPAERASELMQFALPGRRAVLVATSSFAPASTASRDSQLAPHFGRGYGRADIRTLLHLGLPASLEQLAAECGVLARREPTRTGEFAAKEAENSRVLVLVAREWDDPIPDAGDDEALDRALHEDLVVETLRKKRPSPDAIAAVIAALSARSKNQTTPEEDLLSISGFPRRALALALDALIELGLVGASAEGGKRGYAILATSADTVKSIRARLVAAEDTLRAAFENLERGDRERRATVLGWAFGTECRKRAFLGAFGPSLGPCGACDVCAPLELDGATPSDEAQAHALGAFYEARPSRDRRSREQGDEMDGHEQELAG